MFKSPLLYTVCIYIEDFENFECILYLYNKSGLTWDPTPLAPPVKWLFLIEGGVSLGMPGLAPTQWRSKGPG